MRISLPVGLLLAAVLSSSAFAEESLPSTLNLPKGAVLKLRVEQNYSDAFAGRSREAKGVVDYRMTLTADGERFHVARDLLEQSGTFGGDPSDWLARTPKLSFLANKRLTPLSVEEYPAVVAAIFEAGPLAKASQIERSEAGLAPSRRRLFDGMTPEMAAHNLMLSQVLLAEPQARGLVEGQPLLQEFEGGRRTLTLTGLDEKGRAKASLEDHQQLQPGPGATLRRTLICDYRIDKSTGLTVEANCLVDSDLSAPDGMSRKTTLRFLMSQTLESGR